MRRSGRRDRSSWPLAGAALSASLTTGCGLVGYTFDDDRGAGGSGAASPTSSASTSASTNAGGAGGTDSSGAAGGATTATTATGTGGVLACDEPCSAQCGYDRARTLDDFDVAYVKGPRTTRVASFGGARFALSAEVQPAGVGTLPTACSPFDPAQSSWTVVRPPAAASVGPLEHAACLSASSGDSAEPVRVASLARGADYDDAILAAGHAQRGVMIRQVFQPDAPSQIALDTLVPHRLGFVIGSSRAASDLRGLAFMSPTTPVHVDVAHLAPSTSKGIVVAGRFQSGVGIQPIPSSPDPTSVPVPIPWIPETQGSPQRAFVISLANLAPGTDAILGAHGVIFDAEGAVVRPLAIDLSADGSHLALAVAPLAAQIHAQPVPASDDDGAASLELTSARGAVVVARGSSSGAPLLELAPPNDFACAEPAPARVAIRAPSPSEAPASAAVIWVCPPELNEQATPSAVAVYELGAAAASLAWMRQFALTGGPTAPPGLELHDVAFAGPDVVVAGFAGRQLRVTAGGGLTDAARTFEARVDGAATPDLPFAFVLAFDSVCGSYRRVALFGASEGTPQPRAEAIFNVEPSGFEVLTMPGAGPARASWLALQP